MFEDFKVIYAAVTNDVALHIGAAGIPIERDRNCLSSLQARFGYMPDIYILASCGENWKDERKRFKAKFEVDRMLPDSTNKKRQKEILKNAIKVIKGSDIVALYRRSGPFTTVNEAIT